MTVYAWYDSGTINYFVKDYYNKNKKIYLNKSSSYMFYNLSNVESIDLSNFDMQNVTSVHLMLYEMPSLKELKTPKVNANIDISLPRMLYDSLNNKYTKLTSTTPTSTLLKSTN